MGWREERGAALMRAARDGLSEAVRGFGFGEPIDVQPLPDGNLNQNWRVRTPRGSYAVKRFLDIDAVQARRQHELMIALADKGFPVPSPIAAPDGDTVLELPAGSFAVQPWIDGTLREGPDLTPEECARLGTFLGRLHEGLAAVQPAPEPAAVVQPPDPAEALDLLGGYLALLDELPESDEFDAFVRTALLEKRQLIETWAHARPPSGPVGPAQWEHGDFQDLNLLWNDGELVAVLDWDRARVQPIANELVRSAELIFWDEDAEALDLERVATYAAGYRAVVDVDDAQIASAAHRRWWSKLCGFWPLGMHYDDGDRTCDRFFIEEAARLPWWTAHLDAVRDALLSQRRHS